MHHQVAATMTAATVRGWESQLWGHRHGANGVVTQGYGGETTAVNEPAGNAR